MIYAHTAVKMYGIGAVVRCSEEIEKQEADRRYQKKHAAGETDEARADLARLALVRKNREDAAKKKAALKAAQG